MDQDFHTAGLDAALGYPLERTLKATKCVTIGRTINMQMKADGIATRYAFITFSK
jgi:hypothetical protein